MEKRQTPLERKRFPTWQKRVAAGVGVLALSLGLDSFTTAITSPYVAPNISVIHDNGKCPDDTQFGMLHVNGVGQNDISKSSASVAEQILGDTFDECQAALDFGDGYDPYLNAVALDLFIQQQHLDDVDIVALSFGGIATIDMLNKYNELRPNSTVKFSITFISSPSGMVDIQPLSRTSAAILAMIPLGRGAIYAITWTGVVSQGGNDPFNPKVESDIAANADATPAKLLQQQMQRIQNGMSHLSKGVNVTSMYYIYDRSDNTVMTDVAKDNIQSMTGKKIDEAIEVHHKDNKLGSHADNWWLPYKDVYRDALMASVRRSLDSMGIGPKAPIVMCDRNVDSTILKNLDPCA
jgi:hypothetical protein